MSVELTMLEDSQARRETTPTPQARVEPARRSNAMALMRKAIDEAGRLFRLADSSPDRLRIALMLGKLNLARVLPVNTYGWDASIRLHGSTYCVGLRTSEIYVLEEVFNYRMYDRLEPYIPKPNWIVFDLGANVGMVSMLHAQRRARVYAFEPNPDCYRRLLKNIIANKLQEYIYPFNLGLSHEVGTGTMQVERGGTTGGTVNIGTGPVAGSKISLTTLDSMVAALGVDRIDLLKIDVEGHEVSVLAGGKSALRLTERVILEYHSRDLLRQVTSMLGEYGFHIEHQVDYVPEDSASGQEEVGMIYAAKRAH